MSVGTETVPFGGRTAWARNLAAPVRSFLSTETGGAFVMLGAAIAALLWANSPWWHTYESVWTTDFAIRVGSHGIAADLRTWVNQGLMTLFFLVVGLEAKRQLDLGELRERRRLAIPVFAAIGGIAVPIVIYLAFNAGRPGGHGWGAAMSTDTAFALAAVALVTPRTAVRIRVFLLTLAVVDDLAALVVIATVYTTHVSVGALAIAIALFGVLVALRYAPFGRAPISIAIAVAIWIAMFKSGIDPVISGLAIGLGTSAYPPSREDLERATALTREFREQPTPELARSAQQSLQAAISPNERLQYELHPWTSYVIVPLFALANAGIHLTGHVLSGAVSSPITWGILLGYVLGKPVGVFTGSWIASRPALHGPRSAGLGAGTSGGRSLCRHRLHGLAAGVQSGLQGHRARRGTPGRAGVRRHRPARGAGGHAPDSPTARERPGAPGRPHGRGHPRPRGRRRPRVRPHPRPRRRAGHARRVRGLRVPVLRPRRERDPRAAHRARRGRPLRVAPSAAQRRPPRRPARRRGLRSRRRPGPVLGHVRHSSSPTRTSSARATWPATRPISASTSSASGRSCAGANTPRA